MEGLKVSEGKRALKGFEVQGQEQNRSNKADKRWEDQQGQTKTRSNTGKLPEHRDQRTGVYFSLPIAPTSA